MHLLSFIPIYLIALLLHLFQFTLAQNCATISNCKTCSNAICNECQSGFLLSKDYTCYPLCQDNQLMTYDKTCIIKPQVNISYSHGEIPMQTYFKSLNNFQSDKGLIFQTNQSTNGSIDISSGIDRFRGKNWTYNIGMSSIATTIDAPNLVHEVFKTSGYNYSLIAVANWPPKEFGSIAAADATFGDVVVFDGHIGIILDQTTFFGSQTKTGPAVTKYGTDAYWGKAKPILGYYRWKG